MFLNRLIVLALISLLANWGTSSAKTLWFDQFDDGKKECENSVFAGRRKLNFRTPIQRHISQLPLLYEMKKLANQERILSGGKEPG